MLFKNILFYFQQKNVWISEIKASFCFYKPVNFQIANTQLQNKKKNLNTVAFFALKQKIFSSLPKFVF